MFSTIWDKAKEPTIEQVNKVPLSDFFISIDYSTGDELIPLFPSGFVSICLQHDPQYRDSFQKTGLKSALGFDWLKACLCAPKSR